jgi:PEGA domain-containing protein/protein kinase-like protein
LGPVFRAYDAQRERLVAVKVFKLDLPPEQVHRLVGELERLVAADLTHPSMAAPLAAGITGVSAFLAQDYVAAESLDLSLRQYGPASPADALRIAAQLARALDFAAVADVDHGALHPRDVLTSTDETRLTGVGVARALERIGVAAPVRRPYTAPERMAGGPWDRRADVFSLAAVMHEALWGRRVAATGEGVADGLTQIAGAHLATLQATFVRALADDPLDRFETALEFAEALKGAFPHVALLAPVPPPVRSRRKGRSQDESRESRVESGESGVESREAGVERREPAGASQETPAPEVPIDHPRLPLEGMDDLPLAAADVVPAVDEFRLTTDEAKPTAEDVPPLTDDSRHPTLDSRLPTSPPAGLITGGDGESSVLERSQSAVWPIGLALVVGIALGFAGGYGFGVRERSAPQLASAPPPAGHEFTERAVAEPTKVVEPTKVEDPKIQPAPEPAVEKPPAERPRVEKKAEAPAETRNAGLGRLSIRSTPSGAMVAVDGRESGRTPMTVRDLSIGAHRVEITHEGFAPADKRVTITRAHPAQSMTVTLDAVRVTPAASKASPSPTAPAAVSGTLQVESRPAGANVYVDGRMIGTTPLSQAVMSGEHGIRLELNGYREWTSTVRVTAAATSRVTASLER